MWFGPRLGRRARRSNDYLNPANFLFEHGVEQRDENSGNQERLSNANMWFGPRLGKRYTKTENEQTPFVNMWFGPKLRKGNKNTNNRQTTIENIWFEPKFEERDRDSYNEEQTEELWFVPQPKRKGNKSSQETNGYVTKSCNNISSIGQAKKIDCKVKKLFSNTGSMFWTFLSGKNNSQSSYNFTPRLGRDSLSSVFFSPRTTQENKMFQRNANSPNHYLLLNLSDRNKHPDIVYTPRLGRELYEKSSLLPETTRSAPKKSKQFRKYGFFTPRLGRYIDTY
ncbi:hypothetical protein L9F63_000178 [Diploptera punctata]|uniref:FXPRL-amide n=1 Tax=Diploptera punctata TaxID=6984 RepID=A0AAD8ESK6_DIPPU|nr:hypothetical protein L9F63_000178 [Diploptera punctata]